MMKINKNTTFAELIESDKEKANKLAEMGLFCGGCPMAQFETIEQGALAHGLNPEKLIRELNKNQKPKKKVKKRIKNDKRKRRL